MIFRWVLLFLLAARTCAEAAPAVTSVQGAVGDGRPLAVYGSNFSTRSDFHADVDKLLQVFDNFNDNDLTNNPYGTWIIFNAEQNPATLEKSAPRTAMTGDGYYRRHSIGLGSLQTSAGNHREYYSSFYMRLSSSFDISSEESGTHQFKIIRLSSSDSQGVNVYPAIGASDGFHVMAEFVDPQALRSEMQLEEIPNQPTGWHKMAVYIKKATGPSSNDGVLKIWWDNRVVMDITDFDTEDADFSGDWAVGNYFSSASAGTYVDFDDVYLDHTLARVELGNAASYASCSVLENQISTSWSNNAIALTVNQGALAKGAPAYLYVTDKSGAVNAQGFPVTLGSAAGTGGGGQTVPPVEAPLAASSAQAKAQEKFLTPVPEDGSHDKATFGTDAQEVTILDMGGQKIFQKSKQDFGNGSIEWAGRDDSGRLVESGIYIARIRQTDGQVVTQSFVVVK